MTASIYLHVPFCAAPCDYCDFYSVAAPPAGRAAAAGRYVERALEDARALPPLDHVPSLYLGGGTPSIIGPAALGRLLRGLRAILPEWPAEVTVEANPESAGADFLRACLDEGVTRLSLGVQTFHEASRRAVGRAGDPARVRECLRHAARLFPGGGSAVGPAFSVDLLSGLPFQDEAALADDIDRVLDYGPAHVSLYALTVADGTPLAAALADGAPGFPGPDEADRLWLAGRGRLERAGLVWYEVSNFARPGGESRHNLRYWRMENWLGVGPAASGTLIDDAVPAGRRLTVKADVDAWLRGPVDPGVETLDRATLLKETALMGFRLKAGPDPALFQRRFGKTVGETLPRTLARWEPGGWRRRLRFLNAFLRDAFEELDAAAAVTGTACCPRRRP